MLEKVLLASVIFMLIFTTVFEMLCCFGNNIKDFSSSLYSFEPISCLREVMVLMTDDGGGVYICP